MGLVFNYESNGAQYNEVIFTPTGIARLNRFENGRLQTLATASYTGGPKVPFDVTLENEPNHMAVRVDGVTLFQDVLGVNPFVYPQGGVGLMTHWDIGRFDNVQFDHGTFHPCSNAFDAAPPSDWIVSGSWNTTGGTLNNSALESSNIVDLKCAGNDVGADAGTDVQVVRSGIFTTIKVDGDTVLEKYPQGELAGGTVGVVTHWSKGRFDNVSLAEHVESPM